MLKDGLVSQLGKSTLLLHLVFGSCPVGSYPDTFFFIVSLSPHTGKFWDCLQIGHDHFLNLPHSRSIFRVNYHVEDKGSGFIQNVGASQTTQHQVSEDSNFDIRIF
jgi:hypothetical protein